MRFTLVLTVVALAVCSSAQELRYRMTVDGREIGECLWSHQIRPDKGVRTLTELRFGANAEVTVKMEDVTARDGMPILSSTKQTTPQGTTTTVKTYSKTGITLAITANGKTDKKVLPYPKGQSPKSISDLWFLTVRPKVGAKSVFCDVDDSGKWRKAVVTYVGPRTIVSKGKSVKTHLVESDHALVWHNEKGLPVQIHILQGGKPIKLELK